MKKVTPLLAFIATVVILLSTNSCKETENNTTIATDETSIRTIYKEFSAAVAAKDMKKLMSFYAPGEELIAFDAFIPLQYKGAAAYKKSYEAFFVAFPGPTKSNITDINIKVSGNLATASSIDQWTITGTDNKSINMIFRVTNVFEKRNEKWLIIHEHLSFPANPTSGMAEYLSK